MTSPEKSTSLQPHLHPVPELSKPASGARMSAAAASASNPNPMILAGTQSTYSVTQADGSILAVPEQPISVPAEIVEAAREFLQALSYLRSDSRTTFLRDLYNEFAAWAVAHGRLRPGKGHFSRALRCLGILEKKRPQLSFYVVRTPAEHPVGSEAPAATACSSTGSDTFASLDYDVAPEKAHKVLQKIDELEMKELAVSSRIATLELEMAHRNRAVIELQQALESLIRNYNQFLRSEGFIGDTPENSVVPASTGNLRLPQVNLA